MNTSSSLLSSVLSSVRQLLQRLWWRPEKVPVPVKNNWLIDCCQQLKYYWGSRTQGCEPCRYFLALRFLECRNWSDLEPVSSEQCFGSAFNVWWGICIPNSPSEWRDSSSKKIPEYIFTEINLHFDLLFDYCKIQFFFRCFFTPFLPNLSLSYPNVRELPNVTFQR